MREYTFNKEELINDIMVKPWEDNVTLGNKYNISRERVRQIRVLNHLPTVTEAKENWFKQNFLMFVEKAKEGKFVWNNEFMLEYPISGKLGKQLLEKNQQLKDSYYNLGVDVYNDKVYNPTSKVCLSCKEDIEITKYYKSPSDKTRDGYARVCIVCVKENVAKHYELRKQKDKNIPDFKECSAVPEVGLLPREEFRNMASSNTGLQPQCSVFQDFYVKFRKNNDVSGARDLARQATIWYYEKI